MANRENAKPMPAHKTPANCPLNIQAKRETINSRAKGAGGEREFSKRVFDLTGVKLERCLEQSRRGGHDLEPLGDSPAALALGRFAIECKRRRVVTPGDLGAFWRQAEEQASKAGKMPALAFRADRQPWTVLVPLKALNASFGAWTGIEWAAALSVDGFCGLVREHAASLPDI